MYTAKEAYETACQAPTNLDDVLEDVESASEEGYFSVEVDKEKLDEETINGLKQLGYSVKGKTIDWSNPTNEPEPRFV